MRNRLRSTVIGSFCWLLLAVPTVAGQGNSRVQVADPTVWSPLLSTLGVEASADPARYRIVVGSDFFALKNGFVATDEQIRVAAVVDDHDPDLDIYFYQA